MKKVLFSIACTVFTLILHVGAHAELLPFADISDNYGTEFGNSYSGSDPYTWIAGATNATNEYGWLWDDPNGALQYNRTVTGVKAAGTVNSGYYQFIDNFTNTSAADITYTVTFQGDVRYKPAPNPANATFGTLADVDRGFIGSYWDLMYGILYEYDGALEISSEIADVQYTYGTSFFDSWFYEEISFSVAPGATFSLTNFLFIAPTDAEIAAMMTAYYNDGILPASEGILLASAMPRVHNPEPSSIILCILGLAGLLLYRRRITS